MKISLLKIPLLAIPVAVAYCWGYADGQEHTFDKVDELLKKTRREFEFLDPSEIARRIDWERRVR